jgi:type III restriction enzyme
MIILKDYQEKAVGSLLRKFDNLLQSSENEVCVLKAPTGSGKTIICAEFLKRFAKEGKHLGKFSFIWISVRRLHDQSKDKLEWYYESDHILNCSYFEDLVDKKIDENEILFINWDSINKKDRSVIIQENEQDNNLNSVLKNTKDEGRQIILIIDESHHTAGSARSLELIDIISPKITLEVSATPKLQEKASEIEKIGLSAVKEEEMIKSEISINPEFMKIKLESKSATELVLEQALKKREELKKLYKKENSIINPLVLIQLPDKKEKQDKKKDEIIKSLKENYDISEDKGNMAIWLSEEKSNTLPNIEKPDSEVDVLLFKQAIALGWDCPRASILVIFRESTSVIFTIQVIGRIMRMPEQTYYHKEPELNRAFIFTNLSTIDIAEDFAKDYVTIFESKRRNSIYHDIHLKSVYLKRQRERTRLSGEFIKIFDSAATERKLKDKIKLKPSKIINPVIVDGVITNIDKTGEIEHKGSRDIGISEIELQIRFDDFIRSVCSPFAPHDSSDRMKTALYQFFTKISKLEKYDPEIQKIILGKENVQIVVDTINISKETYKLKMIEQIGEKREEITTSNWEIPILISYNSKHEKQEMGLSIMDPFYTKKPSEPEKMFMESLNNSEKIDWWFKNGESEIKYFSVPYVDEFGKDRGFYVDFIISFKDGRIGLFDTKSGRTAKDAGTRSDGLQKYLKSEIKKGKKLIGGILINVKGTWMFYDKPKYTYDPNDHSKWQILEI